MKEKRQVPQECSLVSTGRETLFGRWVQGVRNVLASDPTAKCWRASNLRRVGPSGEAGFEGAGTPLAMGCRAAWKLRDW